MPFVLAAAAVALSAGAEPSDDRILSALENELRGELKRLAAETKVEFGDGLRVSQPSAPGHYRGQVRHTAEPWRRMNPVWKDRPSGTYMDGGYWSVGTACTFAAFYDLNHEYAIQMLRDMLEDLRRTNFAEWTNAGGDRLGACKFLMSVALPLVAVRAVRSGGSLLDEF